MPRPKKPRNDLNDWAMTVQLGKECCQSAQSNGADLVAKGVLQVIGQFIDKALNPEDNKFLYLSTVGFAVGRGSSALATAPTVIGSRVALLPGAFPGLVLMTVGLELGNIYGRTAVLNTLSDLSQAVTMTMEMTQAEIRKPGTARGTKRGIFDCDKCVREKSLPQHGSRLAVPTSR